MGHGPVYQRPLQVSHRRASAEIMLLLGLVKKQEKERRKVSEEAAEMWKGKRTLIRVSILNIGTMTGRGTELEDLMERRNALYI